MTKEQTTQLLAILCAYYGEPKSDIEDMINAWYIAIKEYDYIIAEQACIEYAKNDRREYSQFPTVGAIIGSIQEENKCINFIRNHALNKGDYSQLTQRQKKWITEERFNKLKQCGDDYLLENMETIKRTLTKNLLQ